MFDRTWKWAGKSRRSDKNIGVPWTEIPVRLRQTLDDVRAQIHGRPGVEHARRAWESTRRRTSESGRVRHEPSPRSPCEASALPRQLASIPDAAERLVLATGRYIGEGFDDARLDTLFLAMPISWKGTLIQYSGRLHRRHPAKTEVRIYDYVDRHVPMLLRMFEKRLATYRAIGYARGEAPLGLAEPVEERTVEYEPEALRHFEQDL